MSAGHWAAIKNRTDLSLTRPELSFKKTSHPVSESQRTCAGCYQYKYIWYISVFTFIKPGIYKTVHL